MRRRVEVMRIGPYTRFAKAAVLSILIAGTPVVASAEAAGKYYERSFVLAADARCDLFEPGVVSALESSTIQARGAALRAGVGEAALVATARRAKTRAAGVDCADPDLTVVQGRVQSAFSGWVRTARMTFPGLTAQWVADRSAFETTGWRLMQPSVTGASPVTFGVGVDAEGEDRLKAVVSFVGRPRPYAARIVMRDTGLSHRPWLTADGRAVLPPQSARRAIWSGGSQVADAGLLSLGRKQGEAWVFSAEAALAVAQLDPREPFVVEFLFRDDSRTSATFEAGDFAAGQAFIAMGGL